MGNDLSLCMIVKNEEDWIEQAVSSVISLVDEVIIVDTGSTDRTLERVSRFHPTIIQHEWRDHFGDARNVSLDHANCSWILVLDADESIARRDLALLAQATRGSADGYHLIQRNYVLQNRVHGWEANTSGYEEGRPYSGYVDNPLIRLFRNDPGLRFHGAVHEIVDPTRLPGRLRFPHLPIVIHHYGKVRGGDRVRAKQHLYLELGRKKLADDPGNAKAYLDYGIQLQELGQYSESRDPLLKSFEMGGDPAGLLFSALAEKHLKNYAAAGELLERALREGMDTFEVRLERGNVAFAEGRFALALARYKDCLKGRVGSPVAAFNVGLCYRKLGDLDKAVHYYLRAAHLDTGFAEPRLELAGIHTDRGEIEGARDVLQEFLQGHPENVDVRLALTKACVQLGLSDHAVKLLDGRFEGHALADSLRGAALMQLGRREDACRYLESAIRRDPTLIDAWINAAQVHAGAGDFKRAALQLRQGYERTGHDALLSVLSIYEARAGMLDDALGHLGRVIELGQPTREHWICRTLVLERLLGERPEDRNRWWSELEDHCRTMTQAAPELREWAGGRMCRGSRPGVG